MYNTSQLVGDMDKCSPGVAPGHAGTGVTHDLSHLFALLSLVTMNGALGAGRLGLAIGAFGQPCFGVTHQAGAGFAQMTVMFCMVVFAVDVGHTHHGLVFAL